MLPILSTPWTPTLDRNKCAPYALYDIVVDEEATPNAIDDTTWTMEALELELEAVPDGKDALWEGILALWRLKLCEEEGINHENWQNLVSAWLHRHGELCRYLSIPPFHVVVLYTNTLRREQRLPVQMLPSWDALEAEPEPASDPTPKLNRKQTRMRRSVIAAPQVASEDSDIEMVEASGPSAPVPTRKNKRRARFDLSADESGSQQPESDVGKAGLKRQRSATQEQGSSERVQEGDKPVPPVQRVDLSGRIFGEDTEVSYLLVPALRNKKCNWCKTAQDGRKCVPIWHKNGKLMTLRCRPCMNMKKGCSFRLEDWGIDRWPTLRVTIAGCQRRAEQTQAKRKKPSLGAKEKVAVQSDVIRRAAVTSPSNVIQEEGPALQIRTHFQGDSISAPLPITGTTIDSDVAPAPSPLPSPSPAMVATPAQHGTINSVFLYDILPYKTALSDPESSRYHLKAKGIEVRAIATREVSDARTLANFIECRAGILMDLADMLSDAASAAGDDDTEDAQDGNEDNGGAEVYNGQEEYTGDAGGRENEEVGTG